jgi:hypothetical protein
MNNFSELIIIIIIFTAIVHATETVAYGCHLSGVRTKQVATALSFVQTTLLVSRLAYMIQAPIVGAVVDGAILKGDIVQLELQFRYFIFASFIGTVIGTIITPSAVGLFGKMVRKFIELGSLPTVLFSGLNPRNAIKIVKTLRWPKLNDLKGISLKNIPKKFLILNIFVTAIYTIGVFCALLAGAYLPEARSIAIQLSGIVNGIATILLVMFVDPGSARITDEAVNGNRSENDVKSTVVFLQLGRCIGQLIVAQFLLKPFVRLILFLTEIIARYTL